MPWRRFSVRRKSRNSEKSHQGTRDVSTFPYAVSEPAIIDAAEGTFIPQRRVLSGSSAWRKLIQPLFCSWGALWETGGYSTNQTVLASSQVGHSSSRQSIFNLTAGFVFFKPYWSGCTGDSKTVSLGALLGWQSSASLSELYPKAGRRL